MSIRHYEHQDNFDSSQVSNSNLNCRIIADSYLQNKAQLFESIDKLLDYGAYGEYIAGELCVMKAADDLSMHASSWLKIARQHLGNSFNSSESNDILKLKTFERLSQLKILSIIFSTHSLPTEEIVFKEYEKLVKIGGNYTRKLDNLSLYSDRDREIMTGTLGEIAVLALSQRWAIKEIGTKDWLPIQSSFNEDHGGSCIEITSKPAWDITIYESRSDTSNPIQPIHKIQVKNSPPQSYSRARNHHDIPTIYINKDLALSPFKESSVFRNILLSCEYELTEPNNKSHRLSRELDYRTEKLLDIIDN